MQKNYAGQLKFIAALLVFLLSVSALSAQKTGAKPSKAKTTSASDTILKESEKKTLVAFYRKMYASASEIRDMEAGKTALFALYTLLPEDTGVQMDLLVFYFTAKNFKEAMFLAEKIYNKNNNNLAALDIWAKSQESVGNYSDAVMNYETLYLRTKDTYYQYLSAFCQFQLGRYIECDRYMTGMLQNPDIDRHNVVIEFETDKTQEVPLRAAVLNLQGLIKMELNERDSATKLFNEALKLYPSFVLPQQNLQDLNRTSPK